MSDAVKDIIDSIDIDTTGKPIRVLAKLAKLAQEPQDTELLANSLFLGVDVHTINGSCYVRCGDLVNIAKNLLSSRGSY